MDIEEKLEAVLEWASEHPDFDARFVQDLYDKVQRGHSLSTGQIDALDNIIDGWRIDVS
jgi:hypothetical protein